MDTQAVPPAQSDDHRTTHTIDNARRRHFVTPTARRSDTRHARTMRCTMSGAAAIALMRRTAAVKPDCAPSSTASCTCTFTQMYERQRCDTTGRWNARRRHRANKRTTRARLTTETVATRVCANLADLATHIKRHQNQQTAGNNRHGVQNTTTGRRDAPWSKSSPTPPPVRLCCGTWFVSLDRLEWAALPTAVSPTCSLCCLGRWPSLCPVLPRDLPSLSTRSQ